MEISSNIFERDLRTLVGIARGPGNYATPSAERINRLIERGLVWVNRSTLRPTLKGRIVAWLYKRR